MGNNSSRESRAGSSATVRSEDRQSPDGTSPTSPSEVSSTPSSQNRVGPVAYTSRPQRGSRHDLSFLRLGNHAERDPTQPEPRRETKPEREKRKLEREWEQRKADRERSLKEENVDGGYLVTLGTYTGTEDFNKAVVRQLMIERRIAPFWRPLQDHEDTWTEHQLVAVARGLPLPPADEIPAAEPQSKTQQVAVSAGQSATLASTLSFSAPSSSHHTPILSSSHSAADMFGSPSPHSSTPFFKSRTKALAALKTTHGAGSQTDLTQQEHLLPDEPHINGQPVEAFLYKDAPECPICFLYYPPFLNRTRCCDQPICSECFVQIKRPDPHPPEHHSDGPSNSDEATTAPAPAVSLEEETMLVSEPAACPFCVQPEFGVTYDPPPFKRGLVYLAHSTNLRAVTSTASSSSSLQSQGIAATGGHSRRRGASLSATAPQVVTTDRVRPDWAKKLSDARAHALRRAAAATALHNAAYVLGNVSVADSRGLLSRRRRMFNAVGDPSALAGGSHRAGDSMAHVGAMLAAADRERARGDSLGNGDSGEDQAGRQRGRSRIEDIEELMMLEAIRLSLAEEENRRKREEKEEQKRAAKEGKEERKREAKEEKKAVKEQKKADRAARKGSVSGLTYSPSRNASTVSGLGSSMSNVQGKGKGVDRSDNYAASNESRELSSDAGRSSSPRDEAQRHLEQSRDHLQHLDSAQASSGTPAINIAGSSHRRHLRQLSGASSPAGSVTESPPGSYVAKAHNTGSFDGTPTHNGFVHGHSLDAMANQETPPSIEPMFNFRSLAAVMGDDGRDSDSLAHVGDAGQADNGAPLSNMARGHGSQDSITSASGFPFVADAMPSQKQEQRGGVTDADEDGIDAAGLTQTVTQQSDPYDAKHFGDISVLDTGPAPMPVQVQVQVQRSLPRFAPTNPWANAQ